MVITMAAFKPLAGSGVGLEQFSVSSRVWLTFGIVGAGSELTGALFTGLRGRWGSTLRSFNVCLRLFSRVAMIGMTSKY